MRLDAKTDQKGGDEQNQDHMAGPANKATHFLLIRAERFGGLQVFFNAPARANGLHDDGQGSGRWGKDEEKGEDCRVIKTETLTSQFPPSQKVLHAQFPGKMPLAFGRTGPGNLPGITPRKRPLVTSATVVI
jgi:hypothetical protein